MDKETTKQKKTIDSYDELLERYIGVAGSEERKEFEEELDREVELYALGQSIKDARLSKQLTQEQLGELVGVKR
ncbi:MAG: hypothetical protein LIP03_05845, partial [Bacteroidales bacterium]|nr:hypothetical protein [Bacteroidales bacterium]